MAAQEAPWKLDEGHFTINRSALLAALDLPIWPGADNDAIDEVLVDAMRSAQRIHQRIGTRLPLNPTTLPKCTSRKVGQAYVGFYMRDRSVQSVAQILSGHLWRKQPLAGGATLP